MLAPRDLGAVSHMSESADEGGMMQNNPYYEDP